MEINKQIEILIHLIEALEDFTEYQDGWEEEIEDGKTLLKYLIKKQVES